MQLRLLQYEVQTAPPLRDSGNDLVALRGRVVKTIQVKTATQNLPRWPEDHKLYDLLAVVKLDGEGNEVNLEQSKIYLIPKPVLSRTERRWEALDTYVLSADHVSALFR